MSMWNVMLSAVAQSMRAEAERQAAGGGTEGLSVDAELRDIERLARRQPQAHARELADAEATVARLRAAEQATRAVRQGRVAATRERRMEEALCCSAGFGRTRRAA